MWPFAPIHRLRPRKHVRPFWQDCENIPHNLPYKDLKKCITHGCSFNNHLSENYYWNHCSSILLKRTRHAGAFLCECGITVLQKISISLHTIGVFKNNKRLWKPFRCCSAFLLHMQLGKHKCSSGRSVSEAAPRFRNLCVYEPSALRKKPSMSKKETLQFSEEAFWFVAETCRKCISERCFELRHQF